MTSTHAAMEELESGTCWALLAAAEVGRLAVVVDSAPDVFPVNHAVLEQRVLLRTAAGTKLFAAVGRDVAFEVDGTDGAAAWSVVAKGVVEEVLDEVGQRVADERLEPWLDSDKQHVLAIHVETITGRRFPVTGRR